MSLRTIEGNPLEADEDMLVIPYIQRAGSPPKDSLDALVAELMPAAPAYFRRELGGRVLAPGANLVLPKYVSHPRPYVVAYANLCSPNVRQNLLDPVIFQIALNSLPTTRQDGEAMRLAFDAGSLAECDGRIHGTHIGVAAEIFGTSAREVTVYKRPKPKEALRSTGRKRVPKLAPVFGWR